MRRASGCGTIGGKEKPVLLIISVTVLLYRPDAMKPYADSTDLIVTATLSGLPAPRPRTISS